MTASAIESLRADVARAPRIRAIAAGKAAAGMAIAAQHVLGRRIEEAIVTASIAADALPEGWQAFPSGHPYPTVESERAGRAALDAASRVKGDDLLLVLLSGGASAMLSVPAPGLTLEDKIRATKRMLLAGLDIASLNVVRRHLSAIKGGQLAARASGTVTLAISDVSGAHEDDATVIGSGPTVGDPSTFDDAIETLKRHDVTELPAAVMKHLEDGAAGRASGPVAPDDPRLANSAYWIIGSRHEAMRAAADTARALGYTVRVRERAIDGEARAAAGAFVDEARGGPRPLCVVASGETTVRVTGPGRGGRNQEFAVAALERLVEFAPAALASVGTDGIDGPTDAAGAMVDSSTWRTLGETARDRCAAALAANDAYPLLDALGALVRTGPTGTNVGDLQVLLLP